MVNQKKNYNTIEYNNSNKQTQITTTNSPWSCIPS
jgi:hypothetical protein